MAMRTIGLGQVQRLANLEAVMKALEADCDRAEFWAAAWQGLVAPIPSYETVAGPFRTGPAERY
jgi:hypothetical protein